MKKLIILILSFCCFSFSFGQIDIDIIGSDEYGRIFDVNYDRTIPDKLYAITLGNHILTSEDNGQNWEVFYSVSDGSFGSLNNNLRTYHNDKLTYSLGQSENSSVARSVYLLDLNTATIDHQYTAPIPNSNANSYWVNSYSISDSDSDYALISIGYKIGMANFEKTFYTQNGGSDWSIVYDTIDNFNVFPNEVTIHPTNPEKLFITMGLGDTNVIGGLWVSDDGGQTWADKIPGIVLQPISFNPDNHDEIWAGTGISFGAHPENLYKSTDGGDTWNIVPINWDDYQLDCINIIKFNPDDSSNIIVLEENAVAITNDGGENWDLHIYPNASDNPEDYYYGLDASFNPFEENEIFISGNYYPMFSTDGGQSMTRVKTPFFPSGAEINYFNANGEEHLYYGVQYGFVHKNMQTNEEEDYDILPLNYATTNSATALFIDKNIAGRVYSFTNGFIGAYLNVSNDYGANSQPVLSSFTEKMTELAVSSDSSDKIWAAFADFNNDAEVHEVDFSDMNNIQVNQINLPSSSGLVMGILFDPNDSQNLIIAKGSRIFKSVDGGGSWTMSSDGLENLDIEEDMIFKLIRNPLNSNQVSIASNKGIFTSVDNGENWTQLNNIFVHNISHSTINDGQIIAARHNSSVSKFKLIYSNDSGETWHEIPDEDVMFITTSDIFTSSDFDFHGDFADAYIGTSGLGVVKFTIDLAYLKTIDFDLISDSSIIIWPNPTTDFVNIESQTGILSATVFSMTGQKLLSSNSDKINVSQLSSGIYLIRILLENGKTETKKLMKK